MMDGYGYGGYGGYGNGGFGMMGIVMPLIFGIVIVLVAIYLFRRNTSHVHTGTMGQQSGMDILRERYARGEIDSVEYQSRKQDLDGK